MIACSGQADSRAACCLICLNYTLAGTMYAGIIQVTLCVGGVMLPWHEVPRGTITCVCDALHAQL